MGLVHPKLWGCRCPEKPSHCRSREQPQSGGSSPGVPGLRCVRLALLLKQKPFCRRVTSAKTAEQEAGGVHLPTWKTIIVTNAIWSNYFGVLTYIWMLTDFRGKHDWKIAISSICQFEIFFLCSSYPSPTLSPLVGCRHTTLPSWGGFLEPRWAIRMLSSRYKSSVFWLWMTVSDSWDADAEVALIVLTPTGFSGYHGI